MRFLIDAQALTAGIQSVIKALPLRTSMQILEGVHVVAEGGVLRLMCSDLMLEKECRLPAAIEQEGRAIHPRQALCRGGAPPAQRDGQHRRGRQERGHPPAAACR